MCQASSLGTYWSWPWEDGGTPETQVMSLRSHPWSSKSGKKACSNTAVQHAQLGPRKSPRPREYTLVREYTAESNVMGGWAVIARLHSDQLSRREDPLFHTSAQHRLKPRNPDSKSHLWRTKEAHPSANVRELHY